MSRYCLDTSAYSRFRRGDAGAVEAIDQAAWIGVPAVVLGELWTGFLQGRHRDRNAKELARFLAHPVVHAQAVNEEVARIYGEIVVDLRRAGTPLPTNDIWVAATAVRAGAAVLTYDAHFRRIDWIAAVILQ